MLKVLVISLVLCEVLAVRGPHHPRGEFTAKHHEHYTISKIKQEKLTQDTRLLRDVSHTQEHLEEIGSEADLSTMNEEELEFYYFRFHDSDSNSKLDGLEILQAIHHTLHSEDFNSTESDADNDITYYTELIDRVLEEDDVDHDGYLSYPEYVAGRRKDIQDSI